MRRLTGLSETLYEGVKSLPIVSPHGHCDPAWFAQDVRFANPAELLVIPDHYVFRMLYSQGVPLEALGIGAPANPRAVFRLFAQHWHLFLGTPSRIWMEHVLHDTLGVAEALSPETADVIYDQIDAQLAQADHRPRALFERFGIELLATTDAATDDLRHHAAIRESGWTGRVIPTFRPDGVLDPNDPDFASNLRKLAEITQTDISSFDGYLQALRERRAAFIALGATATDHAQEQVWTCWLSDPAALYDKVVQGKADASERAQFYGHMLVEMAHMSVEDGLVMQLHGGSRRNTNAPVMARFGRDKGADIPVATDWVRGLDALLARVGNDPRFRMILFTLDEATYARELAPMAGHWPCLRIGPPWWFHDSPAGIARYFDQVVETAGYHNLAGFNDDTRAFLSIPARHDLWRRGVAVHLAQQVSAGHFDVTDATHLAQLLSTDLARTAYRLEV